MADTVEPQSRRLATDATFSILSDGKLAPVMHTLSDSFATREAVQVRRDTTTDGALTDELKRTPDILVLEDTALSHLPRAAQVTWYVRFAADVPADTTVQPPAHTPERAPVSVAGRPVIHGLSIPSNAPNPRYAERFVRFILSADGRRILRAAHLDPLDPPTIVGEGAPQSIVALMTATVGTPVEPPRDTGRAPR